MVGVGRRVVTELRGYSRASLRRGGFPLVFNFSGGGFNKKVLNMPLLYSYYYT